MKWPRTYKESPARCCQSQGPCCWSCVLSSLPPTGFSNRMDAAQSHSPSHCFVAMVPHWAWWNTAEMLSFMDHCLINALKRIYCISVVFHMNINHVFIVHKEAVLCLQMCLKAFVCMWIPTDTLLSAILIFLGQNDTSPQRTYTNMHKHTPSSWVG